MKKCYEKPAMLIEQFEIEDVITTSNNNEILAGKNVTFSGEVTMMTLGENVLNSIDYTKFKPKNYN